MKIKVQTIEHNKTQISYTQSSNSFLLTSDSVLLADFIDLPHNRNRVILDVGTGQGLIPLLLSTKINNKIYGIEVQKELVKIAKLNIHNNNLSRQIEIIEDKFQNCQNYFSPNSIDILITNPPYFKINENRKMSISLSKAISRHEVEIDFEEISLYASKIMKQNGHFYFIQKSERFIEILTILKKHNLEPKRIRFIHHNRNSVASLFLVDAIYYGKSGLKIEPPIFLESEIKSEK